jgi:hypothetical protein
VAPRSFSEGGSGAFGVPASDVQDDAQQRGVNLEREIAAEELIDQTLTTVPDCTTRIGKSCPYFFVRLWSGAAIVARTRARQVVPMVSNEPAVLFPASAPDAAAAAVALDTDFDTRWAAWLERGRIHDQRVRRRVIRWAWLLAVGAAIVSAFVR